MHVVILKSQPVAISGNFLNHIQFKMICVLHFMSQRKCVLTQKEYSCNVGLLPVKFMSCLSILHIETNIPFGK